MKFCKRQIFLYLALAGLAFVIPYASNGTVVLLVLSVFCVKWLEAWGLLKEILFSKAGVSILGLLCLGLISSCWANNTALALHLGSRLMLLFIAGLLMTVSIRQLSPEQTEKAKRIVIISTCCILCFYTIDILSNGAFASFIKGWKQVNLNKIGRGASVLAVMIYPIFLMLLRSQKRLFAGVFLATAIAVIIFLPMAAAVVAVGTSAVTFVLVYLFKRPAVILIFLIFSSIVLAAPTLSTKLVNLDTIDSYDIQLASSWKHRLIIWKFVSGKTAERPFFGHGLNSSREMGEKQGKVLLNPNEPKNMQIIDTPLPLHPHNGVLQIWLELGLLGIFCYLGFILGTVRFLLQRFSSNPLILASTSACFVSFLTISSLSFGVWQNWWLAGAWLSTGIMTLAVSDKLKKL